MRDAPFPLCLMVAGILVGGCKTSVPVIQLGGVDTGQHVEGLPPRVFVTPESYTAQGACEAPTTPLTVSNLGQGPLTIHDVDIEGAIELSVGDLPRTLNPMEEWELLLAGTGDGTVVIFSDDPVSPFVRIPVEISLDTPPQLQILSPIESTLVAAGGILELEAVVAESEDDPSSLTVVWTSDLEGAIGTSLVGLDGVSRLSWSPFRVGPQVITASVVDACGNEVVVQASICHQGEVSTWLETDPDWIYSGSAYRSPEDGVLHITDDLPWELGSAFRISDRIDPGNFGLDLWFFASGTGLQNADGFAIVAMDAERFTSFLGPAGGGLGYGAGVEPGEGLPGVAIEVDTSYNASVDPMRSDHIALSFDGAMASHRLAEAIPDVEDGVWHHLQLYVSEPSVQVILDGELVVDTEVVADWDFAAYLGFTASTGSLMGNHWVDDVLLSEPACD